MNIKELLVGSTGFVGKNIAYNHNFSALCHSTDITNYYQSQPELCIYAGIPSAMYLANNAPEKDLSVIKNAMENIRQIKPKKLVLISTIAVYKDSRNKYEEDATLCDSLSAYGYNRLLLEEWVKNEYENALIVRLPALYGIGQKKNFLYDLHVITPAMLTPSKYKELAANSKIIAKGYSYSNDSGYYKLNGQIDSKLLKDCFSAMPFNALNFTDSRSKFQFYNLSRLYKDITLAIKANLSYLNLTPPPISAREIYETVTGKQDWENELQSPPFDYDLRSHYSELFGGDKSGYLSTKDYVLSDICKFMKAWT